MGLLDKAKAKLANTANDAMKKISCAKNSDASSAIQTCSVSNKLDNYNYKEDKVNYDRRVQLNCCPIEKGSTNILSSFSDRVAYVLGREMINPVYQSETKCGKWYLYGALYSLLHSSAGLIFPYTPRITVNNSINYEKTSITNSNLSYNYYKNTEMPTYDITAKFTADNRENAKHMLSALWFFMATTKCEFGESSMYNRRNNDDNISKYYNDLSGLPPPVLYLNGYNKMYENIPVVITQYNYTMPNDIDYVNLKINISQRNLDVTYSVDSSLNREALSGTQYVNGELVNNLNTVGSDAINVIGGSNGSLSFSYWLPLELEITCQLAVQPNLLKYKKLFNLDDYKTGLLFLNTKSTNANIKTVSPTMYNPEQMSNSSTKQDTENDYSLKSYTFNKSGWFW